MRFDQHRLPHRVRPVRDAIAALAIAAPLVGGLGSTAYAQLVGGGLSDTGLLGSNGSLRDTVSSLLTPPAAVNLGRPWTFSGDVDVEVGATDSPGGVTNVPGFTNTGGVSNGWQPLIILAPDFNLNGVTSRLNVSLSYSPRLAYYPSSSNQTLLSNTFNGTATATLVPDWLYFNLRGVTGLTSRFGGTSLLSNSFYTNSDAVQTSSFSASPYIQHPFGDWGTLTVSYTYSATFQDADNGLPFYAPLAGSTAGYGSTGNLTTNTEAASFVTGDNFGRVQDSLSFTASQNGGSSFYVGSSTINADNQLSYVLYRWLTLIGRVGYEKYDYPRANYRLSDVTWAVGFTLTPNVDSSLTVLYGRRAGIDTVMANGSYSVTARTRVFGSYNVDIETGLGARQNLLGATSVGAGGLLIDRITGAPVITNTALASQFSLSRVKTLTAGGILLLDRDTFSATFSRSEVTQLVQSVDVLGIATPPGTATTSTFGTLSWEHDLNPSNTLTSSISYGTSDTGAYFGVPGASQDTLQVYSGLQHIFTDTLSGSLSYTHAERFGSATQNLSSLYGGNASQNTILVGLRKSF